MQCFSSEACCKLLYTHWRLPFTIIYLIITSSKDVLPPCSSRKRTDARHGTAVGKAEVFDREELSTLTLWIWWNRETRWSSDVPRTSSANVNYLFYIQTGVAVKVHNYRPRSRGDNTFGSGCVCACVCPSVWMWTLSCLNRFTFDLDFLAWGSTLTLTSLGL